MEANCDDFEVLLEQRRHGALPAEQVPALEAHLATCARCRAFEARATELQRDLALSPPGQMDWSVLRVRVEKRARAWWKTLFGAALSPLAFGWTLPLVPALSGVAISSWSAYVAGLAVSTVPVAVAAVVAWRRSQSRLRAGTDLLPFLRSMVRRDLARTYAGTAYLVAVAAWFAVVVPLWHREATPAIWVARLLLSGGLLAVAAYNLAVRIPQLRRERMELEATP